MKDFNITGICNPAKHYMVDLTDRLSKIKEMVDAGEYLPLIEPDSMVRLLQYLRYHLICLMSITC